jgi:hypothetical protein
MNNQTTNIQEIIPLHKSGNGQKVKVKVEMLMSPKVLSHVRVTIDGVWTGNQIYWTLTPLNYK